MKDYRRLKADENSRLSLNWNLNREISKLKYRIHTDAIKDNLIPPDLTSAQIAYTYVNEADMLNVVLFGKTGKIQKDRMELLRQLAVKQLQTLETISLKNLPKLEEEPQRG